MIDLKTQTLFKLKQAVPYDMQAVLESLFFQSFTTKPMTTHSLRHLRDKQIVVASVDLATKALNFLNYVRKRQVEGKPYKINEWYEYLSANGLTVSTYETIKSPLLREQSAFGADWLAWSGYAYELHGCSAF